MRFKSPIVTLLVLVFLALSAARFLYSVSRSPKGWDGVTYMDLVYERQAASVSGADLEDAGRWWGPMFFLTFRALKAIAPNARTFDAVQRVVLTALWLVAAGLIAGLASPERPTGTTRFIQILLVAIALQSTAAIYAIAAGMGEVVTGFCVIAHCYLFARRRYYAAALLLLFGVYFKVWPLLFLWPYLVFAAVSPSDRPYWRAVAVSGLGIALVALTAGWWLGPLYPLALVTQTLTSSSALVPLTSREVFGLTFLVSRLVTGFNAARVEATSEALIRSVTLVFSILMFVGVTAAAIAHAKLEARWNAVRDGRRRRIVMFQTTLGLIYISCAMDVSLGHLVPLSVGLYAAPIVFATASATLQQGVGRFWRPALLFALGAWLIGALAPLSIVLRLFPLAVLQQWTGNVSSGMIPQEQYMWYQIPLLGVYVLGAAAWLASASASRLEPVAASVPSLQR